jgi:hypothetical protein
MVFYDLNVIFTAEPQRTLSRYFFHLPVIRQTDWRTGRAANENPQALRAVVKMEFEVYRASLNEYVLNLARRAVVFHFLASQQKVKR